MGTFVVMLLLILLLLLLTPCNYLFVGKYVVSLPAIECWGG